MQKFQFQHNLRTITYPISHTHILATANMTPTPFKSMPSRFLGHVRHIFALEKRNQSMYPKKGLSMMNILSCGYPHLLTASTYSLKCAYTHFNTLSENFAHTQTDF